MLTIRLALYIFYNTVQSRLDTKMRSIPSIRCLPKMSSSSSTSVGSQIATWRRSLTWRRREFSFDLQSLLTGKMFVWLYRRFSMNPAQRDILPHRQSQLSDLTIRLLWSLYHRNGDFMTKYSNGRFDQFNFLNVNHVTNRSSSSLVKSPSADIPLWKIISM